MSKQVRLKIEDVCEFIGGSQPPKSTFINHYKEGYTRLVQTRDFKTDKFPTYIPTNTTTKFFDKNDIIIGRYGPPIFQIFRGKLEGAYNVALMKAVPKENITNEFLYYFLIQKEVFEYVDKLSARTGGQTGVDLFSLYKYPIHLPEKGVQQKIASVLSALDSKIELNNRINAELEAMAKMLYDYWFVQFDFPDKNGKPYKTSGGKMVWNEELKRDIPEGWEVEPLFKAMDVQYGFPFSTLKFTDEVTDKPVIRIRDILENTISTYTTEEVDDKYRLKQKDLLIGMDGNFHLNFWDKDGAYLNQRSVRIRAKKDSEISNLQAYFELKPYIKARENNVSRTTVGHLSDKDLKRLFLISPSRSDLFKPKNLFENSLSEIISNRLQNQKLTELRDWLLPMLMNGQVKVMGEKETELSMAAEPKVKYEK
jgi:type I restriction enzyme S subunit